MRPEDRKQFRAVRRILKNGHGVRLRFLDRRDGPRLAAFYARVPRRDFRFYCPYALTAEQAERNAAAADDPRRVVLVLEDPGDDSIGGYAWYQWKAAEPGISTFGICIRPDFQGIGAGRKLMTRLLDIAARVGPPRMQLTVQKANPGAVHLYRRMGFDIVREQSREPSFGFGPEPEYAMQRRIR